MYKSYKMTKDNIDEIAEKLTELLGDKQFTSVITNSMMYMNPDVGLHQKLSPQNVTTKKAINTRVTEDYCHLSITYTGGVGCISNINYDVVFEIWEGQQVTIKHKSSSGNELNWQYIVE